METVIYEKPLNRMQLARGFVETLVRDWGDKQLSPLHDSQQALLRMRSGTPEWVQATSDHINLCGQVLEQALNKLKEELKGQLKADDAQWMTEYLFVGIGLRLGLHEHVALHSNALHRVESLLHGYAKSLVEQFTDQSGKVDEDNVHDERRRIILRCQDMFPGLFEFVRDWEHLAGDRHVTMWPAVDN
jgi:hypothetical protein